MQMGKLYEAQHKGNLKSNIIPPPSCVKVLPLEDVPASAVGGGREDRVRRRTDSIESELNARFE